MTDTNRATTLAIDVGTGSVRAALVGADGLIKAISSREHDQTVPRFGWSEQRPADWWNGVAAAIRTVLAEAPGAAGRIEAVCACGQMHATVLVDANGELTRDAAPLWNDKRTTNLVASFERGNEATEYLPKTGNPATPAWPGFKLQWIRDEDGRSYERAAAVMMPKDYVNFRLTGEIAMDRTEAACSFLMDPRTGDWSPEMAARLGLDLAKLPTIRMPLDALGSIGAAAARETGLREGTPVLVGGGDYPVALAGSGVLAPGLGSEMIGTSCIVTAIGDAPLLDPAICNVGTVDGAWGAFMLLESGGDAMRWARRAFHEKALSYDAIVARAGEVPAGADRLFFMPYLVGERLGAQRNARAQFFGLTAEHGLAHLHRSIMEGVAFAVKRHIDLMEANGGPPIERLVASGGGARTDLWLRIKASSYGVPILVPREAECGLVGCAMLAATATGRFRTLREAANAFVAFDREVAPEPRWAETYGLMQPFFEKLYHHSQSLYDELDALP